MPTSSGFTQLGLHPSLIEGLTELGYEDATPIQQQAIPAMASGVDLICQAATGTGKTAAFALPIITGLGPTTTDSPKKPRALVLTPTRELCIQVAEAVHRYGRPFGVRTLPVYGGQPLGRQVSALKRGVDVVVATPGRAVDLIDRRYLRLDELNTVVLDEADEMLDMGFADELETILAAVPEHRQTVMFSATMPKRIKRIAETHLNSPTTIEIARTPTESAESTNIEQRAYVVSRAHKPAALGRILDTEMPTAALVFCRTRSDVDDLSEMLNARGFRAEALHGGMDQAERDRVMGKFRTGAAELLVATDVAARGLDVEHLSHVINYDVPAAVESYVHRIGRVGRGSRKGIAITLAEPREQRQLGVIEKVTKNRISRATLPSAEDMRSRRLGQTRLALQNIAGSDDLEDFRTAVDELLTDYDSDTITLAAVKLAHLANFGETDEGFIPQPTTEHTKQSSRRSTKATNDVNKGSGKGSKREASTDRSRAKGHHGAPVDRGGHSPDGPPPRGRPSKGRKRIQIGLGKDAGVRPQDIVGAIANESQVSGAEVGAIKISARSSTVEVPAEQAKAVVNALMKTRIQGRKVKARLDRH